MFNLHELVTTRHLNALACLMLASITVNLLGYLYEIFMTWFTGNMFERETMLEQLSGVFAPLYWPMLVLHVGVPQALWWRRLRISPAALVIIAILVNLGIWLDHYLTIVTYEAHGFMPSAWRMPLPTVWDWLTVVGSLGLFITLMFGFLRLLPVMVMFELRKPAN
jgi:molybdopterin-containing oxidoreductase family membrane subunit